MSEGDDNKPTSPSRAESTDIAPAYDADLVSPPAIDPWTELTPGDPTELASVALPGETALPGFVAPGQAEPAEVTGAEIEVIAAPIAQPEADAAWTELEDQNLGPAAPPDWADAQPDPEPEFYAGDGPFAAPQDAPAQTDASRFADALKWEPSPEMMQDSLLNSPVPEVQVPAHIKAELEKPHRLKRRAPSVAPRTVADVRRAAKPASPRAPKGPEPVRHYPKMRALLEDPDSVPYGIEPPSAAARPPVPGTFFPTPRAGPARPAAVDLDGLLLTMAEGLLIGEGPSGGTEVRVTLKDEFFAGTELRIAVGEGAVKATLVPPDREVYWQLSGHISELEERLNGKGLKVRTIEVLEPGA